jgi:tetratricopeptide (TPR) repeat protein
MRMRSLSVLLPLVLAAALGAGCSKAARTSRAIERADRFFQGGDYARAEVAYSNACRMTSPPSPVALRQLGLVFVKEGRAPAALSCLFEAAKTQPDNAETQRELANLWAMAGHAAEAKEAARHALKLLPGDEKALLALCQVMHSPDDALQTRRFIEQLQKQDQDRASYHLALSMVDFHDTNMVAAESELNKAKALDPNSSLVYVALARLSAIHNNLKEADENFKTAVKLAPSHSPVPIQYAEFLVQTGQTNQARDNMLALIRQTPDYLPPLVFMTKFSFAQHKLDECSSFISQILDRDPGNFDALLMKAQVSLEKKDGKQAVADFTKFFARNPRGVRPQDQYQLALAYLLTGDKPKALSTLNRCLQLDTNFFPAKLKIASLDLQGGNPAAASSLLTQVLKQPHVPQPLALEASLNLAQAFLLQNEPSQAIAIYHNLASSFPKEALIPYLEGQAWSVANKPADARAAFDKSLALNPDHLPALEALVRLDLRENHFPAALERVKKQLDRNTNAPLPWLLLAEIHLQQKDLPQAQADLDKVIQLDPKLPTPYLLLARLYVTQNQQKQALDKLNTLLGLTNNAAALLQIGLIHDQMKDFEAARQSYEKILATDPQSVVALNNLACLYSEHLNDLDKAYKLAEKGRELSPFDPYIADTLGWILLKKHDYQRSLALLQESLEKQSGDPEIQYHAGMAYYLLGEETNARFHLKIALAKPEFPATNEALLHLKILDLDPQTATPADRAGLEKQIAADPADPIALLRLAVLQERAGEFEKAAASYDKIIQQNPENARAAIRLAVLDSTKLNQAAKGLEIAKNAHALTPDDPYISETLGRMFFQARDYSHALSQLQAASRLLPGKPDLLHDLAWAYFSVGNVAAARASMQSALQTTTPFDQRNDAAQFLEVTELYTNPAQPQAAARVQKALQADPSYAPALMASGLLLEQQSHPAEAEQTYEKVLAAYPLFGPALRQAAILYARDPANDAKAYDYARKALTTFPEDADLAKAAGLLEYRRKDYSKSLQFLTQSAQKKQNDAELLWYQGMDYYSLNQSAAAKTALQRAVQLKLPPNLDTEAKRVLALLK